MPENRLWPVSIKGVLFLEEKVVLLLNDRAEWELPGGRLEKGETPEACLIRELNEELGCAVAVDKLLLAEVLDLRHTKHADNSLVALLFDEFS
jgi:8-oxo-dGTP pyrophosphatase MutT (NUDIX family)